MFLIYSKKDLSEAALKQITSKLEGAKFGVRNPQFFREEYVDKSAEGVVIIGDYPAVENAYKEAEIEVKSVPESDFEDAVESLEEETVEEKETAKKGAGKDKTQPKKK